MTRSRVKRGYARSSDHHTSREDAFCLTPFGVRVGYSAGHARVVWISTASAFYAIRGVRPGTTIVLAAQRLKLRRVSTGADRDWFLAPDGRVTAIVGARRGIVDVIGIAAKSVTSTGATARALLQAFS
jgi:hypothetical protein